MTINVLSVSHLRDAARHAALGPYVAGAGVTRPWWRLLAVVLATVALGFVLFPVIDGVVAWVQQRLGESNVAGPWRPSREAAFLAITAVAGLAQFVVVILPACLVYWTAPRTFLWPRQRHGVRLFVIAFVAMFVITAALSPLTVASVGSSEVPLLSPTSPVSERLLYAVFAVFALALPVLAEETLFRGVLLRISGGLTHRVWLIVLVNAVLFSAFHTDPDPVAFIMRMMTGAFWAWSALRLGGVAFALGSHLASNLSFALLVQPGSMWTPGTSWPISVLALQVIVLLPMLVLVEVLARRHVRHPSGASDDESP